MRWLADVNLWIATLHEGHPHHEAAITWWREKVVPAGGSVYFCRITQLGLLRLLGNERVMGPSHLSPDRAWTTYGQLLAQPPIDFAAEPADIEAAFAGLTAGRPASPGIWTDAYLAAFARTAAMSLATFDRGLERFPGVRPRRPSAVIPLASRTEKSDIPDS